MPVLYLLPYQNGHRVAKGSPDSSALFPGATLTLSCQSWMFACKDPFLALPELTHCHPSCFSVWDHHLPFLVLPLWRFKPVSALDLGGTVRGGEQSQDDLHGHHGLPW